MSDDLFHLETLGQESNQKRSTVSKLTRVDWIVSMLALGGVLTMAWIGFLLWVAFKVMEWAFS